MPQADAPTMWLLLERRVEQTPDLVMAVNDRGLSVTFAGFYERVLTAAAGLAELGVTAQSRVSWMLPTWQESLVLAVALARIGASQNPILPIYRERETGFIVDQCGATHLVVPPLWRGFDYGHLADRIASSRPRLSALVVDRALPAGDSAALSSIEPPTDPDAVRWVFYTSGTTSDPKGARHSDATLIAAAQGMTERLDVTATDRNALVFPITHIAGPIWIAASLLTGCANLLAEVFDPLPTSDFLAREGVTLAGPGAAFHNGYLAAQRRHPDQPQFPTVRCCTCGGAPRPPHLHETVKKEIGGAGVLSSWGLTEAPILTFGSYTDSDEQLAVTEGRPVEGATVIAVDAAGAELPPGSEGELVVSARQLMHGYVDESLNAAAFDSQGRFRSGDLGVVDAGGYIRITGRKKDVIIRNGENISAKEVEDLLHEHPRVADVAVVGLPSPVTGELACAVIQPTRPGDELGLDEVQQYLRSAGLRIQAIPERLEHRAQLPRDPSGKVLKRVLRMEYQK